MKTYPVESQIDEWDIEIAHELGSYELFDVGGSYINCKRVWYFHFGTIPSSKSIDYIKSREALNWLEMKFADEIIHKHYREDYCNRKRKMQYRNVILILKSGILVDLEGDSIAVLFEQKMEVQAQNLVGELKRFKEKRKRKTTDISLVFPDTGGLSLVDCKIKKPKLEVNKHYNDDLTVLHQTILKRVRKKDSNGLVLFHGIPGTGKSTYIRYLIHCQNKKVIFLPPKLAANLDSPELTKMLIKNANSIIVIEDAEDLLVSRDTNHNSGISMLLNLTDGLLGESLGIQVICTFNTHVSNIDKALLRKGRLIALYEFKALAAEKANALLEEMGIENHLPAKAMSLAELYHLKEEQFRFNSARQNKIGFMAPVA